ncbi:MULTISPECIES: hypothetical protein [unclassified Phyllobacterium]|uniref:hypothetical protein n=1 Tax=unclassified Phyllobacterium TaxID=2638441 RepID=UPI0004838027
MERDDGRTIERRADLACKVVHELQILGITLIALWLRRLLPTAQFHLRVREIGTQFAELIIAGGTFLYRLTSERKSPFRSHYPSIHVKELPFRSKRSFELTIVDGEAFGE